MDPDGQPGNFPSFSEPLGNELLTALVNILESTDSSKTIRFKNNSFAVKIQNKKKHNKKHSKLTKF